MNLIRDDPTSTNSPSPNGVSFHVDPRTVFCSRCRETEINPILGNLCPECLQERINEIGDEFA